MYSRTTVIVNRILECRGDLVIIVEGDGISSYNRNYYRIVEEGEE